MLSFVQNLSIRTRATASSCLFIVVILAMGVSAYNSIHANMIFSAKEKMGNDYQMSAVALMADIARFRVDLAVQVAGGAPVQSSVIAAIDSAIAALETKNAEYEDVLKLDEGSLHAKNKKSVAEVKASWMQLKSSLSTVSAETQQKTASLLASVRDLVSYSGDTSNLILDPDLDTYYLMDVTLLALPQSLQRFSDQGEAAFSRLYQGTALSTDEKTAFAVQSRMIDEADVARIKADFETSFAEDANFSGENEGYAKRIEPLLTSYTGEAVKFEGGFNSLATDKQVSPEAVHAAWVASIEASYKLWQQAAQELDTMLGVRVDGYKSEIRNTMIIMALGLLIASVFFQAVLQSIITPLAKLTDAMGRLSGGDMAVDVGYRDSKSEIGHIARALDVFRQNMMHSAMLEEEKKQVEFLATAERKRVLGALADEFERKIQGFISAVVSSAGELEGVAMALKGDVSVSHDLSGEAVGSAAETVANVNSVAVAAEEMSSTISEISTQAQHSNSLVTQSVEQVKNADQIASELRKHSQSVKNVIQLISNISNQINLLALNATIESARAGEAGKGFAVVAGEVRNLASQTDKSIKEVENVIANISISSERVAAAMSEIRQVVDKIHIAFSSISSAVEEQSAVVNDIAQSMTHAAQKTEVTKMNIAKIDDYAKGTEKSSETMVKSVSSLSDQSEELQKVVTDFLKTLRSA